MRDLNQLRQAVQENPDMAKQVQDLIKEMERLDPARFPGNPALVEQLHSQVLADVDKLELNCGVNSMTNSPARCAAAIRTACRRATRNRSPSITAG